MFLPVLVSSRHFLPQRLKKELLYPVIGKAPSDFELLFMFSLGAGHRCSLPNQCCLSSLLRMHGFPHQCCLSSPLRMHRCSLPDQCCLSSPLRMHRCSLPDQCRLSSPLRMHKCSLPDQCRLCKNILWGSGLALPLSGCRWIQFRIVSFPGFPRFSSSVCVQYNCCRAPGN